MDIGYTIDPVTLREVPNNIGDIELQIAELWESHSNLGELVSWLRIVGRLAEAREVAELALVSQDLVPDTLLSVDLIEKKALTTVLRYAHVLQWQGELDRALALFTSAVRSAQLHFAGDEPTSSGKAIEAFALQHRGKCYFELGDDMAALSDFSAALSLRTLGSAPREMIESTETALAAVRRRRGGANLAEL